MTKKTRSGFRIKFDQKPMGIEVEKMLFEDLMKDHEFTTLLDARDWKKAYAKAGRGPAGLTQFLLLKGEDPF